MIFAGLLGFAAGCQTSAPQAETGQHEAPLSPVLQRMRSYYHEDLGSGRFVSLADFETPAQVMLFRCVGPDRTEGGRTQPTLSILRSRNETGAGGLKARLAGSDDSLRFDGQRSQDLALLRDWRKYSLLLMSIYGPADGLRLELGIESGQQTPLRWSKSLYARPGWNLYRIDLATVADWIDLADVRALSWRAPDATQPVELYLDDIILADNSRYLVGQDAQADQLYVLTFGRRIRVGVRGRFELDFADGVIVRWQSGDDENLCDVGGLGPWPIPLADNWADQDTPVTAYDDPALFADWGATVAASQRIDEVTPFRVVIEGRWRFTHTPGALPEKAAVQEGVGHTWRYVVYPCGTIYVQVNSRAPAGGWGRPRVGYAIGLDGRRGFECLGAPPVEAHPGAVSFVLLARSGSNQADLLWTWPASSGLRRRRDVVSEDERRLAVIVGDLEAVSELRTAHLLRIWPSDMNGTQEAGAFAEDYRNPATVRVYTGRPITEADGDLDHDGFNESEGCYELGLDNGALRFDFQPGPLLRFDCTFRTHQTAGRQCWVYARGRLVEALARDARDNLLFCPARIISAPTAVEVHASAARP